MNPRQRVFLCVARLGFDEDSVVRKNRRERFFVTEGNPKGESQGRDEQSLQARHKIKHLQHSPIDRFSSVLQVCFLPRTKMAFSSGLCAPKGPPRRWFPQSNNVW